MCSKFDYNSYYKNVVMNPFIKIMQMVGMSGGTVYSS